MRRAATAALLLATVDSFPSDLLKDDCAKGVLLVDGGLLPPIMGIPPTVDETILRVVDLQSGDAVRADAEVPVGAALTLSFDQLRLSPKAGTQIVFVVSAGQVDDGLRCGPGGAQLQCSSCGETHGYLESTTWRATTVGRATLAIGAARGGYGTPAVRVGRMNVTVVPYDHERHRKPMALPTAAHRRRRKFGEGFGAIAGLCALAALAAAAFVIAPCRQRLWQKHVGGRGRRGCGWSSDDDDDNDHEE